MWAYISNMLHATWEVKIRLFPTRMGRLVGFLEISWDFKENKPTWEKSRWYFDNECKFNDLIQDVYNLLSYISVLLQHIAIMLFYRCRIWMIKSRCYSVLSHHLSSNCHIMLPIFIQCHIVITFLKIKLVNTWQRNCQQKYLYWGDFPNKWYMK